MQIILYGIVTKFLFVGLILGIVLVMGCSKVPAENRSIIPGECIFSQGASSVYVFTYEEQKYMIATNGYQGGVSIIKVQ